MPPDIARLQTKLDELRRRDPQFKVFGASTHRYVLDPCLSKEQIREAESQYGIDIPEEYRNFLLFMGNGGAGPAYGDFPLKTALTQSVDDVHLLRLPFPHVRYWNIKPEDIGLVRDRDYAIFDEIYGSDAFAPGALRVSPEGDGYFDLLVVIGEERGHMWLDGRTSDGGIEPMIIPPDPDTRMSFSVWYEYWLDRSLAKMAEQAQ